VEAEEASLGQSVVAVQAGERLTERQMLEGLLIPSGNNIARMLAVRVAGSEAAFIARMNDQAHDLGMGHTTYTDPSGWETGTTSTAADQLRLFRQAMRFTVFRQIVEMPYAALPVAGTVRNTNPILGDGYFGKTGSESAAGACLAFFTHAVVKGHRQTVVGVVLGQWEPDSSAVILAAAGHAAEELVGSLTARRPTYRPRIQMPIRADNALAP
jgi:D-alanyl-D-alanine carboxypeptidase (penicillin-binding protein 5/6)